jgi:hypothetical protein
MYINVLTLVLLLRNVPQIMVELFGNRLSYSLYTSGDVYQCINTCFVMKATKRSGKGGQRSHNAANGDQSD